MNTFYEPNIFINALFVDVLVGDGFLRSSQKGQVYSFFKSSQTVQVTVDTQTNGET